MNIFKWPYSVSVAGTLGQTSPVLISHGHSESSHGSFRSFCKSTSTNRWAPFFSRANPVAFSQFNHEDHSVSEVARACAADDRLLRAFQKFVVHGDLEPNLFQQPNLELRPPVALGEAALLTASAGIRYRPPAPEAIRPDPKLLNLPLLLGPPPSQKEVLALTL